MNRFVIFSVFVVASCGLAYELIAGALASYLLGDTILQFSSIIGAYLCAMGVGSHLSRYVKDRVAERFVDIEILVGLIGGSAATLLFTAFAWAHSFRPLLYALVSVVGVLVGMEIPFVMRMLNERKAEFSNLVANVLTFDYLGALAVSLLFPLVLAPRLGLMKTSFLFGLMNVGVALMTIHVFRNEPEFRARGRWIRGVAALVFLAAGFQASETLTGWVEKGIYGDEVIYARSTHYQRIVVTRWKDDLRLWLNGNLQFSSRDEHRYHEALVHAGLASLPWARRVLILGGGDGMAAREVLKYPNVESVTLVDLDQGMTDLFASEPGVARQSQSQGDQCRRGKVAGTIRRDVRFCGRRLSRSVQLLAGQALHRIILPAAEKAPRRERPGRHPVHLSLQRPPRVLVGGCLAEGSRLAHLAVPRAGALVR